MPPKLNRERALFVLGKIDEILCLGTEEGKRARHKIRGIGPVSFRSSGWTILAA